MRATIAATIQTLPANNLHFHSNAEMRTANWGNLDEMAKIVRIYAGRNMDPRKSMVVGLCGALYNHVMAWSVLACAHNTRSPGRAGGRGRGRFRVRSVGEVLTKSIYKSCELYPKF